MPPSTIDPRDGLVNHVLHDLSAPALVTAIEANLFDLFHRLGRWPRAEWHEDPELWWAITDIPSAMFNCALRPRFTPDGLEAALEAVIARYQSGNVPAQWWTGPTTTPPDLGARLVAHGFRQTDDGPGMAVDLRALNEDTPLPPGFTIEKVNDAAALRTWFRPFVAGFEVGEDSTEPFIDWYEWAIFRARLPLQAYLGRLNGEPVACSSVYYGAGVAGIYDVATVPETRRQGIGALITLAPLRDARALGYRAAILHASQMGRGVYTRLGFRQYCTIGQYMWSPGP